MTLCAAVIGLVPSHGNGALGMSTKGRFCWHELSTTDVEAAKSFYGKVVG